MTLAWEIVWQSPRLIWSLAACLAFGGGVVLIPSDKARVMENFEAILWLAMVVSMFLTCGIFHHAEHNRQRDWHGFPYRMFALPVSTLELVGCPMFLGVLSVGMVYLIWAKLIFSPLGRFVPLQPALIVAAGMIWYQAIIWSLAAFRITRIVVLAAAAVAFMDVGFVLNFREDYGRSLFLIGRMFTRWSPGQMSMGISWHLGGLALIGFAVGWYSVDRQRRGGGRGRGWFKALCESLADALPRRASDFGSTSAAQFWFEWRRCGWLLPVSVGSTLLLVFCPPSWFLRKDPGETPWIMGWLFALPPIMAAVVGRGFIKPDVWTADLSVPPFLAVRPITSGEIVITKMRVAAVSVAGAWILIAGFLVLWLSYWANTSELKELWEAFRTVRGPFAVGAIVVLAGVTLLTLTWRMMIGSLWTGLRGSPARYIADIVLYLAGLIVAIRITVYVLYHFDWKDVEQFTSWAGWILAAAVAFKLWLAAFSWRSIGARRSFRYALIWTGGTACTVALALLVCPDIFWIKYPLIFAAILPMPLACLGLAPAALSKNRHR
jgi:hypothetical protein